jgi:hypothetical protein
VTFAGDVESDGRGLSVAVLIVTSVRISILTVENGKYVQILFHDLSPAIQSAVFCNTCNTRACYGEFVGSVP